jgi:hypothetical protein
MGEREVLEMVIGMMEERNFSWLSCFNEAMMSTIAVLGGRGEVKLAEVD